MSYQLTIEDHPAQARHPFTNEPLFDNNNKPVALFPEERSVRLDGRTIAYVSKERNVMFIIPKEKLGLIANEALNLVKEKLGESSEISFADPLKEQDELEEEED